eukprot:TRINITY_DN16416_c0_g1_i1.p1 TRINITY_DN16416_c0_g1~~TRINITY_DN16416_c0_g1_i1.p1  ORF type:complete len:486 (+),score=63.16 TRINITY_DN16416_c0_g1_i1:32-1489(+)
MEGKKKVFSCIMVCLSAFTQGTMFLWNSFSLPKLEKEALMDNNCNISDSNITMHITEEACVGDLSEHHLSFIASAHSIGAALGALFSGSVLSLGPLNMILPILSIAVVLSWAMMVHAPSLTIMVVGKILLGLSVTLQCSQVPLYIAHVAPSKHRGLLLSSFSIIRNLSQIIVTASAELLPLTWRVMTYIFGIVPAVLLALAGPCLIKVEEIDSNLKNDPDSVAYGILNVTNFSAWMNSTLINQKHPIFGKCISLVPNSVDNIAELSKLPEMKKELERNYGSAKVSTMRQKNWSIIKSTLFLMFFASSYILSGMVLITNFPSKLFTSTYPFKPLLAMSVSLFSNLIGSIISSFLTDKFGVGIILMVSSSGMAFCMSCLSVYYNFDMCSTYSLMCYFPLIVTIIFFISLSIGIGTIFIVIIGEKLPLKKRSLTMPLIMVTMEILEAVQNFILPLLISYMNTYGLTVIFGGHAVANMASVLVAFLWLE